MRLEPTQDEIAAIRDLIDRSQLRAVEFHEVSAQWIAGAEVPRDESGQPLEENLNLQIQAQHQVGEREFGFRLVGAVGNETKEAKATVAVTYDLTDGEMPELVTLLGFANEVGIMVLLPYLREGIGSTSAKVFNAPILVPVLPRHEVGFDLDLVEETVQV